MRSGDAAAAWAEARDTFTPVNNCLRAVLVAYDVLGQIEPLARADATATEAWDLAVTKHAGDWKPPRGALVCFPNWGSGKSGHIAIATGGGMVRSTGIDSIAYFTGTIAQVAQRCGNPYAGWTADIAGTPIDLTSTAGGNVTPFPTPTEEDEMKAMLLVVLKNGNFSHGLMVSPDLKTAVPIEDNASYNAIGTANAIKGSQVSLTVFNGFRKAAGLTELS